MSFDLANPDRTIHAGVILVDSETEILDVAPIDFLNGIGKDLMQDLPIPDALKSQALDIVFHWVSQDGSSRRCSGGMTVQCTASLFLLDCNQINSSNREQDSFANCPRLDIALMGASRIGYAENEAELAFIRKTYDECSVFLTICGGFVSPLKAGLLKGKTATAPRMMVESLRKSDPETNWIEKRWANDGKIWTSGTLLNGLDMMTAFARQTWPGKSDLIEAMIELGGWPDRAIEY